MHRTSQQRALFFVLLFVVVGHADAFVAVPYDWSPFSPSTARRIRWLTTTSNLNAAVFKESNTDKNGASAPKNPGSKSSSPDPYMARPPDRDAMIARAAVLRQSILKQQLELQQLERTILCCSQNLNSTHHYQEASTILDHPVQSLVRTATQARETFRNSFNVLLRKINRVKGQVGADNKKYRGSTSSYVVSQTVSGLRILDGIAKNPLKMRQLATDPSTPTLIPHLPSIYARLDRLEGHVDPILEKVLNKKQHLASIEPYL